MHKQMERFFWKSQAKSGESIVTIFIHVGYCVDNI